MTGIYGRDSRGWTSSTARPMAMPCKHVFSGIWLLIVTGTIEQNFRSQHISTKNLNKCDEEYLVLKCRGGIGVDVT